MREKLLKIVCRSWRLCRRPTTTGSGIRQRRISAGHRMTEAVPARIAFKAGGELGHDVAVPQQYPIHRLAGRNQLDAILGEDNAVDQGIDRWILDARKIARAGPIRHLRPEEVTLLVARRRRLRPQGGRDVKIETAKAVLVLHAVDGADIHGDTEPFHGRFVEKHASLVSFIPA
jgi:hypothetical protein